MGAKVRTMTGLCMLYENALVTLASEPSALKVRV